VLPENTTQQVGTDEPNHTLGAEICIVDVWSIGCILAELLLGAPFNEVYLAFMF
jgi:serine/threonine protein kinase